MSSFAFIRIILSSANFTNTFPSVVQTARCDKSLRARSNKTLFAIVKSPLINSFRPLRIRLCFKTANLARLIGYKVYDYSSRRAITSYLTNALSSINILWCDIAIQFFFTELRENKRTISPLLLRNAVKSQITTPRILLVIICVGLNHSKLSFKIFYFDLQWFNVLLCQPHSR